MALLTFPFSPLPAGTDRFKNWNEEDITYDSGDSQGLTAFFKPLYEYNMPMQGYTEVKQSSLWSFWDKVKGKVTPFLMKDPYDNNVSSVLAVRSGISTGTLFLYDVNSYMVRADTTSIGSLFSALSGYVNLITNYTYDQDSGVLTFVTKSNTDVWGARSMAYFKKVKFTGAYREASPIWNVFHTNLSLKELP
jgi:hypothetical protein